MVKKITKAIQPAPALDWANLPLPLSNYHGACPEGGEVPRKVVLFVRPSREDLLLGARTSSQHHRYVLIFNLGTEGSVALDGVLLRFREREAMIVFPYQVHTFAAIDREEIIWLFLTFELADGAPLAKLKGRVIPFNSELESALRTIGNEWQDFREASTRLGFLTGDLLEVAKRAEARPDVRGVVATTWLSRVHQRIPPEGTDWLIKDMAGSLGVSEPHLRTEFRHETGISLGLYIRQIRMSRAAGLLHSADRPRIGEVARLCGYDSPYSFSRSFSHAMGCTPSAYRARVRK